MQPHVRNWCDTNLSGAPLWMGDAPASQFNGLSGAGSDISVRMAWHTECNVQAGLHVVFKMSRQISPVCAQPQGRDEGDG